MGSGSPREEHHSRLGSYSLTSQDSLLDTEVLQPTHHHHDHAFGVVDYVASGAKLIVPDHAASYYTTVPQDQIVTYRYATSI